MNENFDTAIVVDAKRLLCPLPLIRLQNKIKTLTKGDVVHLQCSDPGTLYDIPTWCRMYGHPLLKTEELDDMIHFWVEVN